MTTFESTLCGQWLNYGEFESLLDELRRAVDELEQRNGPLAAECCRGCRLALNTVESSALKLRYTGIFSGSKI